MKTFLALGAIIMVIGASPDMHKDCAEWARIGLLFDSIFSHYSCCDSVYIYAGECNLNAAYMKISCATSCVGTNFRPKQTYATNVVEQFKNLNRAELQIKQNRFSAAMAKHRREEVAKAAGKIYIIGEPLPPAPGPSISRRLNSGDVTLANTYNEAALCGNVQGKTDTCKWGAATAGWLKCLDAAFKEGVDIFETIAAVAAGPEDVVDGADVVTVLKDIKGAAEIATACKGVTKSVVHLHCGGNGNPGSGRTCSTNFCATCCASGTTQCTKNDFGATCAPPPSQRVCEVGSGSGGRPCTDGGPHGAKNSGSFCGNDFHVGACIDPNYPVCCADNLHLPSCCPRGSTCGGNGGNGCNVPSGWRGPPPCQSDSIGSGVTYVYAGVLGSIGNGAGSSASSGGLSGGAVAGIAVGVVSIVGVVSFMGFAAAVSHRQKHKPTTSGEYLEMTDRVSRASV